ncbi:hypothetical protein V8F06_008842 [Rhypophila decipiens]
MSEPSAMTKGPESLTAVVIQSLDKEIASSEVILTQAIGWLGQWPRDVLSDLRSAPWTRLAKGYLLAYWLTGLVSVSVTVSLYLSSVSMSWMLAFLGPPALTASAMRKAPGCLPNGEFNARSMRYNVFDPSGLFQITQGFGELSFTQAKIIDVIWDVLVGRIGQMIMAFFEWRALSSYYQCAIPAFGGLGMFQDAVVKAERRSKLTAIFIILSMLFIIAFPTLASAMTGYRPNAKAFVVDNTGVLIPFESLSLAAYVIHDGSRIGFKDGQVIPFTKTVEFVRSSSAVWEAYGSSHHRISILDFPDVEAVSDWCSREMDTGKDYEPVVLSMHQECELPKRLSAYVRQYGFSGLEPHAGVRNDIETQWEGNTLPKPALNISAFSLPLDSDCFWGHDWTNPRTGTKPFSNPGNAAMVVDGATTTYSIDYIQQHGTCQPQGTYQWGFSFLQVFITVIFLLLWTVGTYMVWFGSRKTMMRNGQTESPGKYGAAMLLASRMSQEFASIEQVQPQLLTSRQVEQYVKFNLDGGKISADSMFLFGSEYKICHGLWNVVRKSPWLSGIYTLLTLCLWLLTIPQAYSSRFVWSLPLHLACVFALAIGTTRKSKAFFVILGFLVGTATGLLTFFYGY